LDTTIRVGRSIWGYRGGANQWAWAVHRIAGLGVLLFLGLHIADIFILAFGPTAFNNLLFIYKGPFARVLEIFLAFSLLFHGINGARIAAADFIPRLASLETARRLFYGELVLFAGLFIPAGFFMMWTLPQTPFYHNPWIALATPLAILAFPVVVIMIAQVKPLAIALGSEVSNNNYNEAFSKLVQGGPKSPRSRTELNIWLFMRISGVLLIALALFHMFWLHFVINVEEITFNTIVQRWNDTAQPLLSLFWRIYDVSLLAFAFTHGVLGANYMVRDYIHHPRSKRVFQIGLAGLWVVLMLMGMGIIFFFKGSFS
jgi:succinate dehydrogenase cytochrome b556 subunit